MIALGCDHGGFNLMVAIKKYLDEKNIAYKDFGTDSEASVDYPIYAYRVAKAVTEGGCEMGILCCGTGIGISMAANKVKGVRAAVVNNEFGAEMTRRHNHFVWAAGSSARRTRSGSPISFSTLPRRATVTTSGWQ